MEMRMFNLKSARPLQPNRLPYIKTATKYSMKLNLAMLIFPGVKN